MLLFCMHMLVVWFLINGVPIKGWVTEKKKKKKKSRWIHIANMRAPSNSDALLLPLHQIVSDFCIGEWQEKRLGGVDKG